MRDYWLVQYLLAAVGWGYILLVVLAIGVCLWRSKTDKARVISTLTVLALASVLPIQGYQEYHKQQLANEDFVARQAKAGALFEERCKAAGEKIYRTVEGADGPYLMKIRPDKTNFNDQYTLDDPYGHDLGGDAYIRSMLVGKHNDGTIRSQLREGAAYQYAYAVDPLDGKLYRYELGLGTSKGGDIDMERTPVLLKAARYGVTYDDISEKKDRDSWIAGSSLKIIDLEKNEIIAERVGYMVDDGLGSEAGGRQPWTFAAYHACPAFPKLHGVYPQRRGQTRYFVEKVLLPTSNK